MRRSTAAPPGSVLRMRPVGPAVILSPALPLGIQRLPQIGIDAMIRRLRWRDSPHAPQRATRSAAGSERVEQPPRPLSEMTKQEMAAWAREDPERARRFIRQQERLIRERPRRSRPAPAVSALNRAFVLVVIGAIGYMAVRDFGWRQRMTWAETALALIALVVVWLVLWALIAAWRRRSNARG
jgi:hypothetical protein